MLTFSLSPGRKHNHEAEAKLQALEKSEAVIEFDLNGVILSANENFLGAMGYTLEEIQGRHHSMFVEPGVKESAEYVEFWAALNRGEYRSAEYKRVGKGGREVWIQASYNPISDRSGRLYKVVKFATDITREKLRNADFEGQIDAIGKSQAVIEFNLDGTIRAANANFLSTMGYALDEIRGEHHSMFVEPDHKNSDEYREFWVALNRGEHRAAEYKRIGKGGREVWIQASYNPIADAAGRIYKVVKFASDVTREKLRTADFQGQIEAIGMSQAVIEFDLDGVISFANENFLGAMGYALSEIQGKHHSMFVGPDHKDSDEYREFWAGLNQGEYRSGEYKRIGKGGREVWIQASYNPIRDLNGRPYKVVKYATNVTAEVLARKRAEYIRNLMEDTAAGSEQLNASVREIAESMDKSRQVAVDAFEQVVKADQSTQRLDSAAKSMGGIVDTIGEITGQINLLALNATIESARAGEAGKGFAVVANEVKNLANQARRATEQIEEEIGNMLTVSSDVVGALAAIRERIDNVREYVTSTASAIEEQTSVANEMSNSMQRAVKEASSMGDAAVAQA
ncbi:MAG: PAS domain-containing methyl-accepting chemotaxis protein [Rhodospirillales bacterium]